jgi:hypothetical protein
MSFNLLVDEIEEQAISYIRHEIDCSDCSEDMKERILEEADLCIEDCYDMIHNNARLLIQLITVLDEYEVQGIEAVQFYFKLKVEELYDEVFEAYMVEKQEALEVRFPTDISSNIMEY